MTLEILPTQAASAMSVQELTDRYGPLPDSYLRFLEQFDGTELPENVLHGPDGDLGVRAFVPAADVVTVADRVDGLPSQLIPIAYDGCGNYFCLAAVDHAVYFWDHEVEPGVSMIAGNFLQFLEQLQPDTGIAAAPAPGSTVTWLNPNFKPEA